MTEPRLLTEEETSKIERTFLKVEAIIGKANVGQSEVLQIIADLSQEEIIILIAKLHDLKKAAEERAARNTSEIGSTTKASRQFSPQGMPSCMGDFYDNEVSAVHIAVCRTFSEIDQMINILTEISGVPADSCAGHTVADAQFWPES